MSTQTKHTPDLRSQAGSGPRADSRDPATIIRKLNVVGYSMVLLLVGCFGGWATISELAGAVIASGTVIVETVDKKVQHPTGGVVKEILVRDGSEIEEGQIVVRLDDTIRALLLASCVRNLTKTPRVVPSGRRTGSRRQDHVPALPRPARERTWRGCCPERGRKIVRFP